MYRSGWGSKPDQEATLALRVSRVFFDRLLAAAVPSSYDPAMYATRAAWQNAVSGSDVRLQWDPDHRPDGSNVERRALQLGLRGQALEQFGRRELLAVYDLSEFVAEQRKLLPRAAADLRTPAERVYRPADETVAARIGLAPGPPNDPE